MPFTKKHRSPSTTPVPSTEAGGSDGTHIPMRQWEGMKRVLDAIYDYRTDDGFDPSKLFHRLVNKRIIPEYYDTIKEPIALSTIKKKIMQRAYRSFPDFVRDFALIPHNAQVFNRPDSGAFQDALVIRNQIEKELQKLVDAGLVPQEQIVLPDLGEIPTYEDLPVEEGGEAEEEESGGEDDEEEEEDEDDEEEEPDEGALTGRRKKRGPRASTIAKREAAGLDEDGNKKARGRPPKLLTPVEARIMAVLKGVRKPKNQRGQLMIKDFDRMPDKQAMPEYYQEIKNPMSYDLLKRKVKRKKYRTLEDFMGDLNLMFNNAKGYNKDDSQIFKHATALQIEAGRLYDVEKAKPDSVFADDDGKIAVPDGLLYNGEVWKVGDWVHLQNPNDLTKPIVAQIYRTYRNQTGQGMINVCWYYRPEQTVHRFDKHFLQNEVVKTGRYRDHHVEDIVGRCFIMFTTRYFKGRPRHLPKDVEVYVCEARYNEERAQFNKIKTWASCLPDEVRDRDYEMDLFDHTRKMKKTPTPLAYLLKDEQKETDDLPKPTWGAEGAPPKIGAVHKRPRTDRDSLPPEPTPPPPPKMPTPPPRVFTQPVTSYQPSPLTNPLAQNRPQIASTLPRQSSFGAAHPQQYSASPAPVRPPSAQQSYTPQTPLQAPLRSAAPQQPTIPPPPSTYGTRPLTNPASYRDPPPIEVYTLPELANSSIPKDIRQQYQCDEYGRVLFFTAPPIIPNEPATGTMRHSVRYLAAKARREEAMTLKRKNRVEEDIIAERVAKKQRVETTAQLHADIEAAKRRALLALEDQIAGAVERELGDAALAKLGELQDAMGRRREATERHQRERAAGRALKLEGGLVCADDWDSRVS